ncbi:MAG: DUF932 domain-containing protein [Flavobacteriaceae bacterium]
MTALATRFARRSPVLRSNSTLSDDQIRSVAPSIFAPAKHESRSARYTYVPTSEVLTAMRREGFEPFMVCQTRVRDESRLDFTKHMVRLRHPSQINDAEANEIILINSHDGTSCFQMLAGMLRFACQNGLVCGDIVQDVRVPHTGNIADRVVAGAYEVLDGFELIREKRESMRAITLQDSEASALARSALALRFDIDDTHKAPISELQVLEARRSSDTGSDLWSVFNRMQENLTRGGLRGRDARGRSMRTRAVESIDGNVKLNRALWMLADKMARLKA